MEEISRTNLDKIQFDDRDESVKQKAQAWIESEADLKYRKKYAAAWKAG